MPVPDWAKDVVPAAGGAAPQTQQRQLPDWLQGVLPAEEPQTAAAQLPAAPRAPLGLAETATSAVKNIPSSAWQLVKDTIQPVLHPIETAENIGALGKGVLQKLGVVSGNEDEKYADAVGQFLKDRYGSVDNIKHTLATDPVGMAADVSVFMNPVRAATGTASLTGRAAGAIGGKIAPMFGSAMTHVGERPFVEAFRAGREGGERGQEFRRALRAPEETFEQTVSEARKAVEAIGDESGKVYRSGMVDIGRDGSTLDFGDINRALQEVEGIGKYKGISLETPNVQDVRDRMTRIVEEWKHLPSETGMRAFHTPEGFDALKKKLGYIWQEQERGSPAQMVASKIYNSVKDTIVKQAPAYAKIMEGYSEGKRLIAELEGELTGKTGKPDARIGPALRKLQSTMRNNVHTSYGSREAMAQMLVENGATNLIAHLAGQALSSPLPRGFGRAIVGGSLMYDIGQALLGTPQGLMIAMATLPVMSPRVMGEAAHLAGWLGAPTATGVGAVYPAARRIESIESPRPPVTQYDAQGNPVQQ